MPIYSRLFSLCPRIRKRNGRLIASTNRFLQVLTLAMLYRQVIVDPKEAFIRIRRRYFWIFQRGWRISFSSVQAVTYGYYGTGGVNAWWGVASDTQDAYAVGLRLRHGQERHLFWFYGDGEFTNNGPLPDWWYWPEYVFDFAGTQERESRMFVNALSKIIGVTVVPPSP
jgi:hypothetical protein